MKALKYIKADYLQYYIDNNKVDITKQLSKLSYGENDVDFHFAKAAVFSSQIEGNIIDFDSYLKYFHSGMNNEGKEFNEIEDLKAAYKFASESELTYKKFLLSHEILSKNVIRLKRYRGKLRKDKVGIISNGKLEYMTVEPEFVKQEITKLFDDINYILGLSLVNDEIFYYASMIHLMFEKIHPFVDGNGRAGRLLEKWFIKEKIGHNAWLIQSEQYYFQKRNEYYRYLSIGSDYYSLDMERCIYFLLMLPMSLK